MAARRAAESRSLRIAEGWIVAVTSGARLDATKRPRCVETLNAGPIRALAAVAPRQTRTAGRTMEISESSQGRHAAISLAFGFAWIRRLPRGSHLKCLTTFVT